MTFLHIAVSLPRKNVVRLTDHDRPDMTLVVYRGRKTVDVKQQCNNAIQIAGRPVKCLQCKAYSLVRIM